MMSLVLLMPAFFGLVCVVFGVGLESRMLRMQAKEPEKCRLPVDWTGWWILNDFRQPLEINSIRIDQKGDCVASRDNFYLFRQETKNAVCWRCVVFFPVHRNILQFKETRCAPSGSSDRLREICNRFYGDSPMLTLFRADGRPESCPVNHLANFTYSDLRGVCNSRMSTMNTCADASKLRFSYQACPEIPHSESQVDVIQCLGSWTTNGNRYFAGKIINRLAMFEAENYRCFMYETNSDGGRIGISADAACRGLIEVDSASRIIVYKLDANGVHPFPRCTFPPWLSRDQHRGGKRGKSWHSIGSTNLHQVDGGQWVETNVHSGENRSHAICIERENLGDINKLVVYRVEKCTRGYQCMNIRRLSGHIFQRTIGHLTDDQQTACSQEHFPTTNWSRLDIDTLLQDGAINSRCPNKGRHRTGGCVEPETNVRFGCHSEHQFVVDTFCDPRKAETFECLGDWTDEKAHYLLAREKFGGKIHCFVHSRDGPDLYTISGFTNTACHPAVLHVIKPRIVLNVSQLCEGNRAASCIKYI